MSKLALSFFVLICIWQRQDPYHKDIEYGNPTRIELTTQRIHYYVGEPVVLNVTLHNERNQPIKGWFELGVGKYLWWYHRRVDGEFKRYFPAWLQSILTADGYYKPLVISARGKLQGEGVTLFYNSYFKEFVLSQPGASEFKVAFQLGQNQALESNIVRVQVLDPPNEEREVLTMLSDPDLAQFVEGDYRVGFVEDERIEIGVEKAAAFIKKYGNSMYAPLVKRQLREVLKEAEVHGKLTPKLKDVQRSLPDQQ